jgi:type IV pilus assembly protein PilB
MAQEGKSLGDFLLATGYLLPEQLQEALAVQAHTGGSFVKILANLGYVTQEEIVKILEQNLGIAHVNLYRHNVAPEIVRSIPYSLAQKHQVVPIKKQGNKLTLAMVDPFNVLAMDEVRLLTGAEVEPVVAREDQVNQIINWYFGVQGQVERFRQGFKQTNVDINGANLADIVERAPVVQAVNKLFEQAIQERASDIHFEIQEPDVRVRYRVDGFLQEIITIPQYIYAPILTRIKIMAGMDIAEKRLPQDGRIQLRVAGRPVDMRVSTLPTICGEKIMIRLLDKSNLITSLEQLGFSPANLIEFRRMIHRSYGLVLVTGPTGSGKTTTLYAALQELNSPKVNIVTIEDPVEYRLHGINQVQINTKIGLTFAKGLRSILRQDPNIIMIGEIRDRETADIAVRAALTGHLVFSTLHTDDASGALIRLLDMGVEPYLVASAVIGVVAQRLVPLLCVNCRRPYEVSARDHSRLVLGLKESEVFYTSTGCPYCNHTGYRGRTSIHEIMVMNGKVEELILKKASREAFKDSVQKFGLVSLKEDGMTKVRQGLTSVEELFRVVT